MSSCINGNPTIGTHDKIVNVLEVEVADLFAKPNIKNKISGYLEFFGEVYKIENLSDIESFIELVSLLSKGNDLH